MFMDIYMGISRRVFQTRAKNEDPLPHPPPTHSPLLFSSVLSYWTIGRRENQPYEKSKNLLCWCRRYIDEISVNKGGRRNRFLNSNIFLSRSSSFFSQPPCSPQPPPLHNINRNLSESENTKRKKKKELWRGIRLFHDNEEEEDEEEALYSYINIL